VGLIICIACGRQRQVTPLKRGDYRCTNCGGHAAILVRQQKVWADWEDKDGVDIETATHRTYGGLIWWADKKGYKKAKGWAAHKFKKIFRRWPNGEANDANGQAPSSELSRWIDKQKAAYARERRKREQGNQRLAELGDRISVRSGNGVDDTGSLMTAEDWKVEL
jgi:hypothetical protein